MSGGAAVAPAEPRAIERRAWLTLAVATVILIALLGVAAYAGVYVYDHATRPREARVTVVSGSAALWRESPDAEWRLITGDVELTEGHEISTELGTVVWVTFFDGSTLEVSEHSHVRFERLRESRFSDDVRQIVVRLEHGTVYGALAPVYGFDYAEFQVTTDDGTVTMSDRHASDLVGTFLVEQHAEESIADIPFRAAVFDGHLQVSADGADQHLNGPAQFVLHRDGTTEHSDQILGQLIQNGSFERGMLGWEPIYTASGREPPQLAGRVEIVEPDTGDYPAALRIARPDSEMWARTGVRQRVERTLRLPASLTLAFDVRIEHQGAPLGAEPTVPFGIEIAYIDTLGQERVWRAVYMLERGSGDLNADLSAEVTKSQWTRVIVDLHNIAPIPKNLSTVVVYASGTGYLAEVANLSLTTGEGSVLP